MALQRGSELGQVLGIGLLTKKLKSLPIELQHEAETHVVKSGAQLFARLAKKKAPVRKRIKR